MPREVPMDLLNDSTEEVVYRSKNKKLFEKIAETASFNDREIKALALIHRKIKKFQGPINRLVFRDIFHSAFDFTENKRHLLIDRIFSQFDKQNNLKISSRDWVEGLSILFRDSLTNKANFAYKVYDLMRSNKLSNDQILLMLRGCFIKLPPEEDPNEVEREMVDLLIKTIDTDKDGEVSQVEFNDIVNSKDQLFLECMGPVFPSREATHAFLTTFTDVDQF